MFQQQIDLKEFSEKLVTKVMYNSSVSSSENNVIITLKGASDDE